MSEEIIRNGVDVSGCGYRDTINNTECSIVSLGKAGEDTFCGKCFGNPNCYYKQLKRLQAENERLSNMKCPNCGEEYLSPTGADLFEENERLKKEIKENLHYLACMTEQRNKLKLALEEIKEIENNHNLTINKRREKINNKINEVLDD